VEIYIDAATTFNQLMLLPPMLVSRVRHSVTNFPERGARLATRKDRAYRDYVREEQCRQTGRPARKMSANVELGILSVVEQIARAVLNTFCSR